MYPPPQENEIGLNMNAIEKKIISSEVIKYILQSTPTPSRTLSDFMYAQENCSFQFQMDI